MRLSRSAALAFAILASILAACEGQGGAALHDSGAPGDSDSEIADPCESYPASDDNFLEGSTPRNYTFIDASGTERRLCDFADRKLALLVISGGES
jgi:hypothetical protein